MRALVDTLHAALDKYKQKCDFLTIYILEAHAQDKWPISSSRYNPGGKPVKINQHTTQEERIKVAHEFIQAFEYKVPTLVDSIDNSFESQYFGWPFRFYIIKNGKLAFKAMPKDAMYDFNEVCEWIENDA